MSFRYARHFARIYNTPLLIAPHALDAMLPAVERVLRGQTGQVSDPDAPADAPALARRGALGIIPVHGVLTHRGQYDAACNYLLGYQDIGALLGEALADPQIGEIVLDLDSPGGEVAGCFDLADQIRAATAIKPIHAAINDLGCSAAYALASACTSVSLTRTALVGSIGVVMRHVDMSQWLANEGVKVTHIFAGAHKVDGNPYEPLPEAVRGRFQDEIDALYGLFVATVARYRGLSEAAVIDTQADTYLGQAAVDRGLADRVENIHDMIYRLSAARSGSTPRPEIAMSATESATAPVAILDPIAQTDAEAAVTLASARADGYAEGLTAGAAAERTRIAAILDHPAAAGRDGLARHIALTTALDPEQAAAILAAAPQGVAKGGLAAAMAALPPISIGPGGEPEAGPLTKTREAFAAMDPKARQQFITAGGRVVDAAAA
jgi:signal peptide peptidase SppA